MKKKQIRLKPCPFCGGIGVLRLVKEMAVIVCQDCGSCGPPLWSGYTDEKNPVDHVKSQWNQRKP